MYRVAALAMVIHSAMCQDTDRCEYDPESGVMCLPGSENDPCSDCVCRKGCDDCHDAKYCTTKITPGGNANTAKTTPGDAYGGLWWMIFFFAMLRDSHSPTVIADKRS